MVKRSAHYRCLRCDHEWHEPAGPTQCPRCEHLYVRWVNYNDLTDPKSRQMRLAKEIMKEERHVLAALSKL